MNITYLGHASLLIELGGKKLIVDPFISANPLANHIDIDSLEADYVLITHGHQDHVLDVAQIVKRTDAMIISNFEIVSWFENQGLKGHGMNLGGKFRFDFGTVKMVNAIHSSVLPDGTHGGNPAGFVIWNETECLYIGGDTALTEDMKLIPLTCPKLQVAVLPIGDNFTMGFEDACRASEWIKCNTVLGYHYDTFEPIKIDKNLAIAHFNKHYKLLQLPEIGERLTY